MSLEQARKDIIEYTQGDFSTLLKLTSTSGVVVNVSGLATKHHLGIDPSDGSPVNTNNIHVAISEKKLTELNYPTRNACGEVVMIGHKVEYSDSTGNIGTYRIQETYPDETLGLIVCILGMSN
jgi:hypothetical protein